MRKRKNTIATAPEPAAVEEQLYTVEVAGREPHDPPTFEGVMGLSEARGVVEVYERLAGQGSAFIRKVEVIVGPRVAIKRHRYNFYFHPEDHKAPPATPWHVVVSDKGRQRIMYQAASEVEAQGFADQWNADKAGGKATLAFDDR